MGSNELPDIGFRRATEHDFDWLLSLRRLTMDPHIRAAGSEPPEDVHRQAVLKDFGSTRIVLVDGSEVGMVKLVETYPDWHLRQIQLAPEFQNRGIGTVILQRLLDKARSRSVPVVLNVLRANPARKLYERLGFSVVDEDARAVTMRWTPDA